MSVSILTVTQWSRHESIKILNDLIGDQTYPHIAEWILVEGSPTAELAHLNGLLVSAIRNTKCRIRYITDSCIAQPLGTLRQAANDAAVGDIRVVMDDDDYYPPERVSHAVERLTRSSKRLAGCSSMFMYDYGRAELFQFKKIASTHSTSSCMAWKREYTGSYDPTVTTAEETSFTRGFTEPMVQLDPIKTIIQSSHGTNTYSKKDLISRSPLLQRLEAAAITDYIPPAYLDRLVRALKVSNGTGVCSDSNVRN